jgi:hypothetical protein
MKGRKEDQDRIKEGRKEGKKEEEGRRRTRKEGTEIKK